MELKNFYDFLNTEHDQLVSAFINGYTTARYPEIVKLVEALGYQLKGYPAGNTTNSNFFLLGTAYSGNPSLNSALQVVFNLPENGAPAQSEQIGEAVYPAGQEPTVKPADPASTEPDATTAPVPEEGTDDDPHPSDGEDEYLEEDPDDQVDRGEEEEPSLNAPSAYLRYTCRPTVYLNADYVNFGDGKKGPSISGLEISLPLDSEVVVELGHCPLRITADDTAPDYHEACKSDADSKYPPSLECDDCLVTDGPAGGDGDDETPLEEGDTVVTH